ncbi:substrate-binding periplasmic protein [Desulfosarcina ovata]|nr:transporter substrate-binding domain-containing protein [Desulfosarcina ovata]
MKSGVIRICLAGTKQNFYQKNAMAYVDSLGSGVKPEFTHFEAWDDQFRNNTGEVLRDEAYTPEPLASGKCDMYPNDLVKVEWREKKLAYVPLYISRNTIIVNKTRKEEFKEIKDLAGKTAAVMKETSYHTWLDDMNRSAFQENPVKIVFLPQKDAILAVDAGKADFSIIGADGALWSIKSFAGNVSVAFPVGEFTEYGWCFRKADKDLQEAVARFFDQQKKLPDSELNRNWKENTGITLDDFIMFVSQASKP